MRHKRMSMVEIVKILSRYVNEERLTLKPGEPGCYNKILLLTAITCIVEAEMERHPEWYNDIIYFNRPPI